MNSDKGEIERLLKEFGSKNRPGEARLFYFSGHGVQQDESNYLVPAIFNPEAIGGSTIELATVLDSMADAHERGPRSQKIIILDACRDNRLGATKGLTLPRDAPQDSWWIAFATAPGLTSQTGLISGLSAYTESLVNHIRRPGFSISEMFAAVREEQWRKARVLSWDNVSSFSAFWFQPPPEFKVAVHNQDNVVTVTVNGQAVASGTGAPEVIPYSLLRVGDNLLEIIVYNQKTRRNAQPWGKKEGWAYTVELEVPQAGKCTLIGGRDDLDDSEWGKIFVARRGKLVISNAGTVSAREFKETLPGTNRSTDKQLGTCK